MSNDVDLIPIVTAAEMAGTRSGEVDSPFRPGVDVAPLNGANLPTMRVVSPGLAAFITEGER